MTLPPLLPQLSHELSSAAARLASVPSGRRRRRLRLAVLGVTGIVAIGGVATAATTIWDPQIGSDSESPTTTEDPPPKAQLNALGVLRREQTPADRGAESELGLRVFGQLRGIRLDAVRLLGATAGGSGVVLVSATSKAPGSTVDRLRALKARRDGRPAADPIDNPLCLFARAPSTDGAGVACFSLEQVLAGQAVMGFSRGDGAVTWLGLVPDGIAHVRAGDGPDAPTVGVDDNVFEVATGVRSDPAAAPVETPTLHFLDAEGREVDGFGSSPAPTSPGAAPRP